MELESRFGSPVLDITSNPFLFFPLFPILSPSSLPLPSFPFTIVRKNLIIKSKMASNLSFSYFRLPTAGSIDFFFFWQLFMFSNLDPR